MKGETRSALGSGYEFSFNFGFFGYDFEYDLPWSARQDNVRGSITNPEGLSKNDKKSIVVSVSVSICKTNTLKACKH